MIIIGEKLNSSIPATKKALEQDNQEILIGLIKSQEELGAEYLDLNTAMFQEKEEEKLRRLLGLIEENSSCGIVLDSPSPSIIKTILPELKNRKVIVNSVTITQRFDELMPVIAQEGASVIGLPMDEDGVGETLGERLAKIDILIGKFREIDFPEDKFYIDVIVETLATNTESALLALESIAYIKTNYPGVKTTCGLSNVSFGLPKRANINTAFLAAAIYAGLSSAIIDNTNPAIAVAIASASVVTGQDKNCLKYIKLMRKLEKQQKA